MNAAPLARTSPALRLAVTALVLTNLAFVHATEDASLSWLVPMFVATLASPWLARLATSALYRWLWNGAVLAIFALLVRHTSSAGARYLLEDGLRLAALCQVHVLCTLGERQKPDLLFFNSFLVAVVTAFLTQDLPYVLIFLAFAPLFVLGLSLYAASATRAPAVVVRRALVHAGATLAVTAVVFVAWPRDFRRRGLVVDRLALTPSNSSLEVGFNPEVRLGLRGDARASDALLLRARLVAGDATGIPSYWRGATQLQFDGRQWRGGLSSRLGDARWSAAGSRSLVRKGVRGGAAFDVDLADASDGRVFLPLAAIRSDFNGEWPEKLPSPLADGTLHLSGADMAHARDAAYHVEVTGETPRLGGPILAPPPDDLAPALATSRVDSPAVDRLAASLRAKLPPDAAQHQIVERMRAHLSSRRDYLPPGAHDGARDIEEFMSGRAGGHCEYFATALVLLLRHEGIPCRLVTGYLSDDWDEHARTLTIRRRDAHAWVEVKDPEAGWYTVDPTPAAALAQRNAPSLFTAAQQWLARAWERIVRFDAEERGRAVAWFVALPRQFAQLATRHGVLTGGVLALLVALVGLERRRRTHRIPAAVRAYRACLRQLKLVPRADETPRELLARAAREGLPREEGVRLDAATRCHEAARYATATVQLAAGGGAVACLTRSRSTCSRTAP